jgi:hypothetical protein
MAQTFCFDATAVTQTRRLIRRRATDARTDILLKTLSLSP